MPALAKVLREVHHTLTHGIWLNMAEIELSVLTRQCLARRIGTRGGFRHEVSVWEGQRNARGVVIRWQCTTADAASSFSGSIQHFNSGGPLLPRPQSLFPAGRLCRGQCYGCGGETSFAPSTRRHDHPIRA